MKLSTDCLSMRPMLKVKHFLDVDFFVSVLNMMCTDIGLDGHIFKDMQVHFKITGIIWFIRGFFLLIIGWYIYLVQPSKM